MGLLHDAIEKGDVDKVRKLDIVKELLERGAAVDARNKDEQTPLYIAALEGHLEIVKELLERGAAVELMSINTASEEENIEILNLLLESYRGDNDIIDSFISDHDSTSTVAQSRLNSIYILFQMKCNCNANLGKQISELLGAERLESFKVIISKAEKGDTDELRVVKNRIFSDFLKETPGVQICKLCRFVKLVNVTVSATIETVKEKYPWLFQLNLFLHLCRTGGCISSLLLLYSMFLHIVDIVSDIEVGLQDYQYVSGHLGAFELFLVCFTLIHENMNSVLSLYEAEEETLRLRLGQKDSSELDWTMSDLNHSKNTVWQAFLMFFAPFKMKGCTGNAMKAVLFNLLGICFLRPVVDYLMVLLHRPGSIRVYYRQNSRKLQLRQFYMILEQLPELLIQCYTFQFILFKVFSPEIGQEVFCPNEFVNSNMNTSNGTDSDFTNGMCSLANIGQGTSCSVFTRLVSISIPMLTIPKSLVKLESSFRTLNPVSRKLSFLVQVIIGISFMIMISERIFIFSTIGHISFLGVIIYGIIRVLIEMFVNVFAYGYFSNSNRSGKGNVRQRVQFGNAWNLLLLSFRDVFLLSLRMPHAYRQVPSSVTSDSLRSSGVLITRASVFLLEGLVGAVLLDLYYPNCGESTTRIRYFGWISLLALTVSLELAITVSIFMRSKIVRTTKTLRINVVRNVLIFTFGTIICFLVSLRTRDLITVVTVIGVHVGGSVIFLALFCWLGRPSKLTRGTSKCCVLYKAWCKITKCSKCCNMEDDYKEIIDVEATNLDTAV